MSRNLRGCHQNAMHRTRSWTGWVKVARKAIGMGVAIPLSLVLSPIAYGQSPSPTPPNPTTSHPDPAGATPLIQRATLQIGSQGAEVLELQAALKLLGFYGGEVSGRYDEPTAAAVAQFQQAAGLSVDGVMNPASWSRLFPSQVTLSPPVPAADSPQVAPVPASAANPPSSQSPETSVGGESSTTTAPTAVTGGSGGDAAAVPAATTTATSTDKTSPTPQPAATTVAATTTPQPIALPILRQGMHGPAVIHLQERLRAIGVFEGAIDGIFGAETLAAVKAAQTKFQVDPDGVVGPVTWTVLLK